MTQIHHFKDSDLGPDQKNLYECPNCNKIENQRKKDLERSMKASGKFQTMSYQERLDWEKERKRKMKTEFCQRTLFFDLPENLIINFKRYEVKDKMFIKDHTNVEIKSSIYLDDYMVHRV